MTERAGEAGDSALSEPDLKALVEGIDPLLGNVNLIVRARDPAATGPSFVETEMAFRTESADPAWSKRMESRILDRVSQIAGLSLVTLDAECRETVCRVKLVHPSGTNALSSLERLKPLATELGFRDVVEAATLDEHGAPMSLLYLQRDAA